MRAPRTPARRAAGARGSHRFALSPLARPSGRPPEATGADAGRHLQKALASGETTPDAFAPDSNIYRHG
ncbi:hypothetical protein [Rubricoccus marinus]|uniref:hypothetical protein n=1 Tax=Rubricoccus marinus TaxID=716817 RepID=UPI0015C5E0F2|nr:hypothetical protein [Rubricoccus marinus]